MGTTTPLPPTTQRRKFFMHRFQVFRFGDRHNFASFRVWGARESLEVEHITAVADIVNSKAVLIMWNGRLVSQGLELQIQLRGRVRSQPIGETESLW